jgi:predicted metal-dependent enzyme (double-stranded beta helix superfamily)
MRKRWARSVTPAAAPSACGCLCQAAFADEQARAVTAAARFTGQTWGAAGMPHCAQVFLAGKLVNYAFAIWILNGQDVSFAMSRRSGKALKMLSKERFISDCNAALDGDRSSRNVRDVVASAVSDMAGIIKAFGDPTQGGIQTIYRSPELTIINVLWRPGMIVMPREDNILWRRQPGGKHGELQAAGAKSLAAKEVAVFGSEVIHSVVNPLSRITGAIHVYGGDFFAIERSEWDPEELYERPYDLEKVLRMFAN